MDSKRESTRQAHSDESSDYVIRSVPAGDALIGGTVPSYFVLPWISGL
jgi:hypothetical protein